MELNKRKAELQIEVKKEARTSEVLTTAEEDDEPPTKEQWVQATMSSDRRLKEHRGKMINFVCILSACNAIIRRNGVAHVIIRQEASTQVDHEPESAVVVKKDASSGNTDLKTICFYGYETIRLQKEHLKEMTTVSESVFNELLSLLGDYRTNILKVEDLLLTFLIKLRLDWSFSVLETIFQCNSRTLNKNFKRILDILYEK